MPRKAKSDDTEGKVIQLTNALKPDQVKPFVDRVEQSQADIDAIMEKARKNCQPFRDGIKEIIKEAAEAGLEKKIFRAVISKRRKLRNAEAAYDHLDMIQKDGAVSIEAALGPFIDTPLGQAAAQQ